ncbi:MAG: GDSL-type esterase/lipase family protein [Bacteroidota bacterium]
MRSGILVSSLLLLPCLFGMRGEPVRFSIADDQGLVEFRQNKLERAETLNPFFEKLVQLKTTGTGSVSILHIGDSHIQGDYFTGRVRGHLQREFGNAGRGLVVPGRVAGSNEPADLLSTTTGTWESKRVIYPDQPLRIGIGGITINTADPTATFSFLLKEPSLPQRFATFFFRKDPKSFLAAVTDSLSRPLAYIGPYTVEHPDASMVRFPHPTRQFGLQVIRTLPDQERLTLYGISLTNGQPGILYHAAGVNGAKYKHFAAAEEFAPQSSLLNPDLIVISMGTNEALDYPYRDPAFEQHIRNLLNTLALHHKGVPILLTTPPGSFLNNKKKSPGLKMIAERVTTFAREQGLASYDLYAAGGGEQFAARWSRKGHLQTDGVHFTKAGYELQGDMFYLALINAYNDHVSR